jgi:predicted phage tail protein
VLFAAVRYKGYPSQNFQGATMGLIIGGSVLFAWGLWMLVKRDGDLSFFLLAVGMVLALRGVAMLAATLVTEQQRGRRN